MSTNEPRLPLLTQLPRRVVLDLDGTLFDPAGVMTQRSEAALRWLLDRGIPVIVATARPLRAVRARVGADLVDRMAVIHMNGIAALHPGRPAQRTPRLSEVAARRIVALAAEHAPHARLVCEIDGHAFGCDTAIAEGMLWETNSATPDMVMPVESALGLGICKVAVNGFGSPLHLLIEAIRASVGEAVTVIPDGDGAFLNIVPPGTSKAGALRSLIGSDEPGRGMLAFGDDLGDLEMLLLAEHGVAMANGHPEVLRSARYVTLSNAEDGVAHVLERLIARFG